MITADVEFNLNFYNIQGKLLLSLPTGHSHAITSIAIDTSGIDHGLVISGGEENPNLHISRINIWNDNTLMCGNRSHILDQAREKYILEKRKEGMEIQDDDTIVYPSMRELMESIAPQGKGLRVTVVQER